MAPWTPAAHRSSNASGPPSSGTTRSCPAPTARAGSPTPTTPPPGASLDFIEDFIRDEVLPLYANTHTEARAPACRRPACARTRARIIRDAVGGDDEHVGHLRRLGHDRRDRQAHRHPRPAHPADLDDRYHLTAADPARPSGRWSSSAPTSTTPTSCPGASRSPTSSRSPRTPTATSTSPSSTRELERVRRSPAQDRLVLGRLQRDRHRLRHARHRRPCCTGTARSRSGTSPRPRRTSTST